MRRSDAFESWSQTSPQERARLLQAAADAVKARAKELVPLVIAETGCTTNVGRTMQVPMVSTRLERYAVGALESSVLPLAPQEVQATALAPGGLIGALARRAPVGVVACITSYNFPLVNMVGKLGPALATGNTVVVRPAGQDPLAVIELVRILDEVGLPSRRREHRHRLVAGVGPGAGRVAGRGHGELHRLHRGRDADR